MQKNGYIDQTHPPPTSLGRRGDRHAHATRKCKCQSVDIQSDYVIRQLNFSKLHFNDLNAIPVYLWCVINKYILTIHYCRNFVKIGSARNKIPVPIGTLRLILPRQASTQRGHY